MQANDTITGFESKIYRKDGDIIWISENCRAVRDAEGKLLYYEGTVEDITERKHSEEQIRRTTAELSRSREELRAKNQSWRKTCGWRAKSSSRCCRSNIRFSRKMSRRNKARFNSPTATSRPKPSAAIFSASPRFPTRKSSVFICDVTGHGVRAALVTAMIRALAEELKPLAREPGIFLRKLNSDLVQHPQKHRLADAHDRVLSRRQLPDRRRCVLPMPAIPSRCCCAARKIRIETARQRLRPRPARARTV